MNTKELQNLCINKWRWLMMQSACAGPKVIARKQHPIVAEREKHWGVRLLYIGPVSVPVLLYSCR